MDTENVPKGRMTDADRAELSAKLDKDLDNFMDELAAKKKDEPKKPFDLDQWFAEIENHPAFMTNLKPGANGEMSDMIQALQAMKYEDNEDDVIESATHHKDEGNKHFKYKKYRWAIDCYTNAAKLMAPDRQLNAVIYTNRATAQKYLGNHLSAFKDAMIALKFNPLHCKAMVRALECFQKLDQGNGHRLLQLCKMFVQRLQDNPVPVESQKEWEDTRIKALEVQTLAEEMVRKEEKEKPFRLAEKYRIMQEKEKTLRLLKECGATLSPELDFNDYNEFEWSSVEVNFPNQPTTHVAASHGKEFLEWPIMFQYPEVSQTDYMVECADYQTIGDLLAVIFEQHPEWDPTHRFDLKTMRIFVELDVFDEEQVQEVFMTNTLKEIIGIKDYVIKQGLPVVMVFSDSHITSKLRKVPEATNKYRFSR